MSAPGAVAVGAYRIRRAGSVDDLRACFSVIGAQFSPAIPPDDQRFHQLLEGLDANRPLMVMAEHGDQCVGGALGKLSDHGVGMKMVGLDPSVRRIGLMRRILQIVEVEAMVLGASRIGLGANPPAHGFYERLGFQGRKVYMHKELPLPGRVRDFRLAKLRPLLGDMDTGHLVSVDPDSGNLPALW
jgi:GNAT superfamily N-acetyltransferase